MNKRKERKLKKQAIKPFWDIYKTCKNIASDFNKKTIPITVIRNLCDIHKKNLKDNLKGQEYKEFRNSHINLLNKIVINCTSIADKMNSKEIPLSILKQYIETIDKNF